MKPQETQTRINGAQTNDAPDRPERTRPSKWAIMAIVAVGVFQVFTSSFHTTFLVCAGIAAIGIFASLVRCKFGN